MKQYEIQSPPPAEIENDILQLRKTRGASGAYEIH